MSNTYLDPRIVIISMQKLNDFILTVIVEGRNLYIFEYAKQL